MTETKAMQQLLEQAERGSFSVIFYREKLNGN
jgi:hypothetical protein